MRWAMQRQWPLCRVGSSLECDAFDVLNDVCKAEGKGVAVRERVGGDLKKENCPTRDDE